jgi:acetoin utilization deacetylase AcuC-like enzyme
MKRTGLLYDERFLLHCTGPDHPEAPERLEYAYKGVVEGGLVDHLVHIKAVKGEEQWIEAVHSKEYLCRLRDACQCGMQEFDYPDNQMCDQTYDVVLHVTGGIIEAVRLVMEEKIDNAFCCVRPPGHHALSDKAMGFCYVNNVAVAAKYLLEHWGVKRIGIVDFDAHHGNGTQQIFEFDPCVFYYSIHEHPSFAFPGTGRDFDKGSDAGYGFTLNTPVLPGQGDRKYQELLERDLVPAFNAFAPEVILVSTGFDAHRDDVMSDMKVTTWGFSWMMHQVLMLADAHCNGRLISILEGGYCLEILPELVRNHIELLLGKYDSLIQDFRF